MSQGRFGHISLNTCDDTRNDNSNYAESEFYVAPVVTVYA